MEKSLLQSSQWQTFQSALGKKLFHEKGENFEYFAQAEKTSIGTYLYVPYGPILDKTSPKTSLKSALKSLRALCERENFLFARIEPRFPFDRAYLENLGLRKSKDLNPADTWLLDLTTEKEEILHNFSQGTRTRYNQFPKKGLTVETTTDPDRISSLVALQKSLAKKKKINTFSENYLRKELAQPFATLYEVKFEEKIISASLFFDDLETGTRLYMQSATDEAYKKLPATVALLSTAIFDAKERGLKTFDFWGIAPDDADSSHPWAGFTEFKKSFGGYPAHFAGTYDLPVSGLYPLYSLLRSLNRLKRKLTS